MVRPPSRSHAEGQAVDPGAVALDVRLPPELPADEALLRMLRQLNRTMNAVEAGMASSADTELVHDYRIALRRSRSVLKLGRGVLPASLLDHWRRELRALQQRTGDVRDLDVFVLDFPTYVDALPPSFASELGPLLELLETKRAQARLTLERYLASGEHARLQVAYEDFLRGDAVRSSSGREPDRNRPIVEVGVARIQQAHRKLIRRGRKVRADSPGESLHDVRIGAKELRYAIELNGPLLPKKRQAHLVRRLKRLQTLLGEHQDAEVRAAAMEGFATELAACEPPAVRTIMATGLLEQHFHTRKAELRNDFATRFDDFDSARTRELLDATLSKAGASS